MNHKPRQYSLRLASLVFAFSSPVIAGGDIKKDYPPVPDFETRIDYVGWYESAAVKRDDQDAYKAYARFMPELVGSKLEAADWPKFTGMLTTAISSNQPDAVESSVFSGTAGPFPWSPERKPQWEASYQRTESVLKRFFTASKAGPLVAPTGLDGSKDDKANRLMFAKLPHLQTLRQCAQGSLEAAWRMPDGKFSAKRFSSAVVTNLRVAKQMRDSMFAIEHLVACEVRRLTYAQLRWAFAHEVLTENDASRIAKMLRKLDGRRIDAASVARGECAMWLDALQYVYGPQTGGGLKLNGNRYQEITGQNMGAANRFGLGARIESDPQGAAEAILKGHAAIEEYMRPGYEMKLFEGITTSVDRINRFNKITQAMKLTADFGRIYTINAQIEADRRATQLLVELFAHKARKGKWPKSLESLSKKVGGVQRDVFRDGSFVYLLVGGEPVLYSVGPDGQDDGGVHDPQWSAGADYVLWPIPDSAELLAASRLMRIPDKGLTMISKITAARAGERIVVFAKVKETSSQPSEAHGHRFSCILAQEGERIELVYYQDLADRLTKHQKLAPGANLRVRAVVEKLDDKPTLRLEDPLDLVIED